VETDIDFDEAGGGLARFGAACASCSLAERCTTNTAGRTITIHRHEDILQAHKAEQRRPEWQQAYRSTRPKVERKIGHLVRKPWGGRRARARGLERVITDVVTRAAAVNFSRLAVLGVHWSGAAWAAGP
jgi:Transposase DDE domain